MRLSKFFSLLIGLFFLIEWWTIDPSLWATPQKEKGDLVSPKSNLLKKNPAPTGFFLEFKEPKNRANQPIKTLLAQSGLREKIEKEITSLFKLPKRVVIVFQDDGDPFFDPEVNKILFSYNWVREIETVFKATQYAENKMERELALISVVEWTLFHEIAHSLIHLFKIPLTGKEEDAADGLATILLNEFISNGQESVLIAADSFALFSSEDPIEGEGDFWDEHSLDSQRFANLILFVYGSDPDRYDFLLQDEGIPEDRALMAAEDYPRLVRSWMTLLKPHLQVGVKPYGLIESQGKKPYSPQNPSKRKNRGITQGGKIIGPIPSPTRPPTTILLDNMDRGEIGEELEDLSQLNEMKRGDFFNPLPVPIPLKKPNPQEFQWRIPDGSSMANHLNPKPKNSLRGQKTIPFNGDEEEWKKWNLECHEMDLLKGKRLRALTPHGEWRLFSYFISLKIPLTPSEKKRFKELSQQNHQP